MASNRFLFWPPLLHYNHASTSSPLSVKWSKMTLNDLVEIDLHLPHAPRQQVPACMYEHYTIKGAINSDYQSASVTLRESIN